MMRPWLVAIAAGLTAAAVAESAGAQSVSAHAPRAAVAAVRVTRAPVIDGRLDDDVWQGVAAATDFTQQDPAEGQPASERTEIRITYDDVAVYVAARMYDREPALIARRLSSRDDDSDADFLDFYLDPMHDHLTGAGFQISAAGVQRDAVLYNDTWDDSSWDSVWESAVSVDERHLLSISTGYGWSRTDADGASVSARLSLNIKPSPRLTISTGPEWNANATVAQCRPRRRRQRAVFHVRQPRLQPEVSADEHGVPMGAEAWLGVLRRLDTPAAGRDESRHLLGRPRLLGALHGAGRRHLPGEGRVLVRTVAKLGEGSGRFFR